jgi:methionyl-tRNA formyltransferase
VNLVLITQHAPVYLPTFLDLFLERLATTEHRVVGIAVFSAFTKRSAAAEVVFRLRFHGPLDFLRMGLQVATGTLRSVLFRVGWTPECGSVSNVVSKHRLDVMRARSPNGEPFLRELRRRQVDLVISVASPKIFGRKLLQTPPFGCLNYHSGLLPRYRGVAPLFWALLHGESEVGMTVHEMDEEIDNGPIVSQRVEPIRPDDTVHTLFERTARLGPEVLIEAIEAVARGSRERLENDKARASYFGYPTVEDGRRLRSSGRRFF